MKDIKNITIEAVDYGYIVRALPINALTVVTADSPETWVFEKRESLVKFISDWALKGALRKIKRGEKGRLKE